MSRPDDTTQCRDLEPRIEALVDAELGQVEATALREHLEICPDCARQYRLAADIRQTLRELPELDTPEHILESVLESAQRKESRRQSWRGLFRGPRPAWIALGATAAAALFAVMVLMPNQEPAPPAPSAEVEIATKEARLALAYLDKLTHRAARDLREDVVQRHVVEPTARSLSRSLNTPETEAPKSSPVSDYRSLNNRTRSS